MSAQTVIPMSVNIVDPTASGTVMLLKVPAGMGGCTVRNVRYVSDTALASNPSNGRQFQLQNGSDDGSGSTAMHTAVGGTSTAWVAGTPKEATMSTTAANTRLDEGDWLKLVYTKTGTDSWKNQVVNFDLVLGHG